MVKVRENRVRGRCRYHRHHRHHLLISMMFLFYFFFLYFVVFCSLNAYVGRSVDPIEDVTKLHQNNFLQYFVFVYIYSPVYRIEIVFIYIERVFSSMELKSTKHIVCILIACGMDDVMRETFLAIFNRI